MKQVMNWLMTCMPKGMGVQFRDKAGNRTVDYSYRKYKDKDGNEKEVIIRMIWSGEKHDFEGEDELEFQKGIKEILEKTSK